MHYAREPAAISDPSAAHGRPRLMDEVCHTWRLKHFSLRTEQAHLYWTRRHIRNNGCSAPTIANITPQPPPSP